MSKQEHSIKLSIPPQSDYIGVVRLTISGVATRMNFSVDNIEDIKIAVSEACTNAVQYAYDHQDESKDIQIECKISENSLKIMVQDSGKGFDVEAIEKKREEGTLNKDEENPSLGLGMTFIRSLMDSAEITSTIGEGTTVIMEKKAPIAEQAA